MWSPSRVERVWPLHTQSKGALLKKRQTRAVLVGGLIAAALIPAGAANAAPKANPAVGFGCPKFTVVVTDVAAGFPRGTYSRLNFAPTQAQLSCDYSFHVFRSYLYHPD